MCSRVVARAVASSTASCRTRRLRCRFSFFNDTATTEIYTLSLHDALPISVGRPVSPRPEGWRRSERRAPSARSEEHTSELQSLTNLVCRLLLEKKNTPEHPMEGHEDRHITLHHNTLAYIRLAKRHPHAVTL